jgi:hypothetical protein
MFDNFFPKIVPFIMKNFGTAGQATDENVARVFCMLGD